MNIPIVLVAFGTTSRATETYSFINERLKDRFPDREILWAYSSRMVKEWIKKRRDIELKHPRQVLNELEEKGYAWAVVQSLHLLCGHEFYRMVAEVKNCGIRTSIGLPLLCEPNDYQEVVEAMMSSLVDNEEEAAVLVGHGTDHPIWASYLALQEIFREKFGPNIYVGVVQGHPSREKIVEAVIRSGIQKVRLIPFMLVAGVHFLEDLGGDRDSWKTAFEKEEISVTLQSKGLGLNLGIIDILGKHIQDALDVIPTQ